MIPENIKKLISLLIQKTIEKKAIWNKTARPGEFKLNFENGAITTDSWHDDNEDGYIIEIAIYNKSGENIDRYRIFESQPEFILLTNLYNNAKREYYKVDETINGLFDELSTDNSIGEKEDTPNNFDDLPF